jgi:DNA-binding MarR family transcriptional regulator
MRVNGASSTDVTRRASTSALNAFGPVLFECARLLDEIAQAEVNRQAGRRLLTPALVRLLPHLSTTGIRPTELARRVDVSKQAVGQSLAELVAMGLAELVPDPSDGRARLVRLTPVGDASYAHGRAVLRFYAEALAERIGESRVAELADGLAAALAVLQEWSSDNAPTSRAVAPGTLDPRLPRSRTRRRGLPR